MQIIAILALAFSALAAPAVAAPTLFKSGSVIPNQYIITYKSEFTKDTTLVDTHEDWLEAAALELQRDCSLSGCVPWLQCQDDPEMVERIKALPEVESVEQDVVMSIAATQSSVPSWGLARITSPNLPLGTTYTYPDSAGAGVNIYVIDSGVQITHPDFGGRASNGPNFSTDTDSVDRNELQREPLTASPNAQTSSTSKVFGSSGTGSNSDVIAAVNWVTANGPRSGRPCVVNMSLGGPASAALDSAVTAGVNAGCTFAVAAGNNGGNSCVNSPARAPAAFTVASSTRTDSISSTSDRGTCVDIIAPGNSITSAWIGSSVRTISGTSMASPHVAGVFALAIANGVSSNPTTLQNYVRSYQCC
ncbi:peptidase S8/S53 domain-containing protein [Chytridium lagenaria]|nr:peptidase S8/S53 domain-containing protein [Chytridium lagenaria]